MISEKYTPRIPDIAEAVFDVGYLLFDLIAGIIFIMEKYFCGIGSTDSFRADYLDNCNNKDCNMPVPSE